MLLLKSALENSKSTFGGKDLYPIKNVSLKPILYIWRTR